MWGNAEYTQGHIWLVQLSPLKVGEDGYELEQKNQENFNAIYNPYGQTTSWFLGFGHAESKYGLFLCLLR